LQSKVEQVDELQPEIEQQNEHVPEDLLEVAFKRKNKKSKRDKRARNQERSFPCKRCKTFLQDEITAAMHLHPNMAAGDMLITLNLWRFQLLLNLLTLLRTCSHTK
jgi:hypothetical protein